MPSIEKPVENLKLVGTKFRLCVVRSLTEKGEPSVTVGHVY